MRACVWGGAGAVMWEGRVCVWRGGERACVCVCVRGAGACVRACVCEESLASC